jgi:translation elongation factor P/translation initiation factor 5A
MKHKVIEEVSGNEVKPGMKILSIRNEIYEFQSFRSPQHGGSTGRVQVKCCDTGTEYECYPQVFGLKIVEAQNDPFDN